MALPQRIGISGLAVSKTQKPMIIPEPRGMTQKIRYMVMVDGSPVALRPRSFTYLTIMCYHAKTHPGQWIPWHNFETSGREQVRNHMNKLKHELGGACWENDYRGRYRLQLPGDRIEFNADRLVKHPEGVIRALLTGGPC